MQPSGYWRKMPLFVKNENKQNVDFEAYFYFALSVFWRGSVTIWGKQNSFYFCQLNHRLRKEIQRYLLGESKFPKGIYLWVEVDQTESAYSGLSYPDIKAPQFGLEGLHHRFSVPGLIFRLFIEGTQFGFLRSETANSSLPMLFSLCSFSEQGLDIPLKIWARQATPTGALAAQIDEHLKCKSR